MSNPTDLKQIESRIVSFVEDFACLHTDGESDAVAGQCKRLADAVAAQAVTSSEGGKRLRALLTLEAFRAFASSEDIERHIDEVFGLACAIEVFQTGALVHDDIIDDSDLRRGKPSAHRALAAQSGNDAIGRGLGIMLGDMLATSSVDIVNRSVVGLDRGPDIISAFLNMHREVEIGQVLDLAVELSPLNDPDELARTSLNVFRWKTASYTTIAPLEFGMLAAGETKRTARERALAIGLPLGLAFQLADDLLDVIGSSRNTGKPIGGDIREGKRTVLLADALNAASTEEKAELVGMWESPVRSEEQVSRAIALFESTGAIETSYDRIARLWAESEAAIQSLRLPAEWENALVEACARFVPTVRREQ